MPDVLECVTTVPRLPVRAALALLGVLSCGWPAAAQQAPAEDLPVSLDRIRTGVARPERPAIRIDVSSLPVTRFKTSVEQRDYMLTFEEQLHKDLELTPLQRQSADWASRCCGLDLGVLFKPIDEAMTRRKVRKIRERIAEELEQVKAAAAAAGK